MSTYHHSHFGVYALIITDERLLLIKKARGPYTGLYDLPGGSPEDTELLEETLRREVWEETGCRVDSCSQLWALDARYSYVSQEYGDSMLRHIGVVYRAAIAGNPRTEPDGHDSNGCEWVHLSQIQSNPGMFTPFVTQSLNRIA